MLVSNVSEVRVGRRGLANIKKKAVPAVCK